MTPTTTGWTIWKKAADAIPEDHISILLSHAGDLDRQAAHAGFDLLALRPYPRGQICLPGGIPITLDKNALATWDHPPGPTGRCRAIPSVGAGTCIVNVRFNCPPEITLHLGSFAVLFGGSAPPAVRILLEPYL